jgi:hypothetical protein
VRLQHTPNHGDSLFYKISKLNEIADAMAEAWAKDLQRDGIMADQVNVERVERFATAPSLASMFNSG